MKSAIEKRVSTCSKSDLSPVRSTPAALFVADALQVGWNVQMRDV